VVIKYGETNLFFWRKRQPIVLALGGGGARGFAHIGVLRVLEEEGIEISRVVGTSMGAIVGAVYAQLGEAKATEERFLKLMQDEAFRTSGLPVAGKKKISESWLDHFAHNIRESIAMNIAAHKRSVLSEERLFAPLNYLLRDQLVQRTKIPFAAVATDLKTGEEVILDQGGIIEAVAASASLPGFLPPRGINGRLLIDGAATSPVPIRAAKRLQSGKVIGVDVSQNLPEKPELDSVIDVVFRSFSITSCHYHDELVKEADLLIRPPVGDYHWSEFRKMKWFIHKGEYTAKEQLRAIRNL
jgi:NTE family protein